MRCDAAARVEGARAAGRRARPSAPVRGLALTALLVALATASTAGTPIPATPPPALPAATGPAPAAPSFIELRLALPLRAVRAGLERAFPRELRPPAEVDTAITDPLDAEAEAAATGREGSEREWKDRPVRWRGTLRREPFAVRVRADSLEVTASFGWSVEVLERGLESARCGTAREPISGDVGTASLLGWGDGWSLETRCRPLPTRFAKACRLEPPGLEFTHRVNDRLQRTLTGPLPARVDSVVRAATDQSANVLAALRMLARPVTIGDSAAWLHWNARVARVDPPRGAGDSILTHVTFEAVPSIEPRPGSAEAPPPPAPLVRLSGDGIRIPFDCWAEFSDIAGDLASMPTGRPDRGEGALRVTGARVTGGGDRLAVALDLDGALTGTAWLTGRLAVAPPGFMLGSDDLEWSRESWRALERAAGPSRWPALRAELVAIRDVARRRVRRPLETCVSAWEKNLQDALQPGTEFPTVQGALFQRETSEVFCTDRAVGVRLIAIGRARILAGPEAATREP